jgi:phospholipid-binding lipoprotein MlaA
MFSNPSEASPKTAAPAGSQSPGWISALFALVLGASALSGQGLSGGTATAPSAVLTPDEDENYGSVVSDPFEGFNRAMFAFNGSFYRFVARPVAKTYETVIPGQVRTPIGNFLQNLLYPVRFASSLLQGKFERAALETGKFVLNSTVGLGGLETPHESIASLRDIPGEDFGQTLGVWGFSHGPYVVLPVIGPASVRDTVGRLGDAAATPWSWRWVSFYEWEVAASIEAAWILDRLPRNLETFDNTVRGAADPYIAVRDGYIQFRNAQVAR